MALKVGQQFPRGSGPLISVIFPSRGRSVDLCKSMDSLVSLSVDKSNVEYLIKVDDDDIESIKMGRYLIETLKPHKISVQVIVSPRLDGYWNIQDWLNDLSARARGDWLLNWSDDVYMKTHGWDIHLRKFMFDQEEAGQEDGIFMFFLTNPVRPHNHEFFALRKEVFNILGHLSLSPHADTWLASIMKLLDRCMYCSIEVAHDNDNMNDQTAKDRKEVTKYSMSVLCEPFSIRDRLADATKLLDYIEEFDKKKRSKK